MPGSCEADKSSSSLISSLRSFRFQGRTKCQVTKESSTANTSNCITNSNSTVTQASISTNSSVVTNSVENFEVKRSFPQNSSRDLTNTSESSIASSKVQNYSPLSYRQYKVTHTAHYILPCVLAKFQQAVKKNTISVLDLELKLSIEEYKKLKELILQETSLAEKWQSQVHESPSFVTRDSKELRINRQYLSELAKYVKRQISNFRIIDCPSVQSKITPIAPKPVKTYSRTPKPPKVVQTETLPQSVPNIVNDSCIDLQPPTKGIMDEYEVFCEKEQNLRKLLDKFPGADIMEAQDILVRCNWDLDEATRIAHTQPLRCSKKKALQSINVNSSNDSITPQINMETNHNSVSSNSIENKIPKVTEEIILDSSDEEFNNNVQQMNSKRNSEGKFPNAKRVRKVVSSSESEDSSDELNHSSVRQTNSVSKTSQHSVLTTSNSVQEKSFSIGQPMTAKVASSSSEQSSKNIPNLPKGLVITQVQQIVSSTTLKSPNSENSVNNEKVGTVTLVNKKDELIKGTHVTSNPSTANSNKSAQLVRINVVNNGVANNKQNVGYTIHKTGTVVTLPVVSKGMTITSVAKPSVSVMSNKNYEATNSSIIQEKVPNRSRPTKGKRKKYAISDDEGDDYGNDDIYDSEDSDCEQNLTSAHNAVLKFFQDASMEELSSIPGCSKKKVEAIINIRPFANWLDLVQKLGNDKTLSTDLLNGAKKVLDMRNAISKLMAKCQQISLDMEDLVENLKENKECSSDYVTKQPELLNEKMHLASYQMLGLNWLLLLHNQEVNGILADEMGLGKTVQAISFLAYLKQIGDSGPHLIVVPSSTLDNWKNEFQTWWPSVSILVYRGSQEHRRELRIQILNDEVEEFDVMITTYNLVTSSAEDRSFFKRLEFHYVVFDEAHMLKNMASQRFQHLMRIKAPRRLLLTGTPLQNNLVELMSLLIFAMPHMFSGKTEQIKQMFSTVSKTDGNKNTYEKDRIDHAKRIMKPFVLRRLKNEVLQDLPAKYDETRFCPMTESQAKKYKELVEKFSAEVQSNKEEGAEKISSSGSGMMMQLRRAANHPLLLRKFYDDDKLLKMANAIITEPTHTQSDPNLVFEDMTVMSDFELHNLCKNFKSLNSYALSDDIIVESGKFRVLDELLPSLLKEDHRVLLFSQFTMVLDIVEAYMNIKGYKYMRLDGQTPVSDRQTMINDFNNDSSVLIFLLSTRAGGLGINLTAADTVILHDIDFNPYNDKQAEDRCHRVGQIKDVKVIRCISKGTIEEGILQIAKEKLKLERDIHEENETEENDTASVAKLLRDALSLKSSKS